MPVSPGGVAGVLRSAGSSADGLERSGAAAASGSGSGSAAPSGFDVWTHSFDEIPAQMTESQSERDQALNAGLEGDWESASAGAVGDSMAGQASQALRDFQLLTGQREAEPGEVEPQGALGAIGATFGLLTSLEQLISAPLAMIPFPAFPAIRVMDMDVGLPHAHSHPPNLVPPAPPVPLPSTGPIIPIPFLSGAGRTLINGMPAARCGDMGLGIWCGGYFPMYEVFLGSSSVWIEGARAGRLLVDVTHHCIFSAPKPQDPPLGPMVGMTITSSPNVLIGGVPMPSLLNLAMGAALRGLFAGMGRAIRRARAWNAARLARQADDVADDLARAVSRNSSGAGGHLPRPTAGSYWRRALHAAGGDVAEAIRRRAAARRLIDDMIGDGRLTINGDPDFQRLAREDLYLMASTRTGRETLERIGQPNHAGRQASVHIHHVDTIRADRADPDIGPCAHRFHGDGSPDPVTGRPGDGADTAVYYDPNVSESPNSPPDSVLNHEMAHAANNAEGGSQSGVASRPQEQPHMTDSQRAEMRQDDLTQDQRWTNQEEQNVIRNQDNPYRQETGLPQRFGHGDLEGLNSSGTPRR